MKPLIYIVLLIFFFSSCSHRVVRIGYKVNSSNYEKSDVVITKKTQSLDSIASKVGEIKLRDGGFSTKCSEEHAINILKEEAYALSADLILIKKENRPDLWSSCYRNSAYFYKYKNPKTKEIISSDIEYDFDKVKDRVSKNRKKNSILAIGAVITGILLGSLLF